MVETTKTPGQIYPTGSAVAKADIIQFENEINAAIDAKSPLANSGAFFSSRASMLSVGQPALPGSRALAFHPDGNYLVVRGFGSSADDPLFETAPQWGVVLRVPGQALLDALTATVNGKADIQNSGKVFTNRTAAVNAGQASLPGDLGIIFTVEGANNDTLAVRSFSNSSDDPLFATQPQWGVAMRVPNTLALNDKADQVDLAALTVTVAAKADRFSSGKIFTSRAAAVAAGQPLLPSDLGMIITFENGALVMRAPNNTDDALFETSPRWGVVARYPNRDVTDALAALIDAEAAARGAADTVLQDALDDEEQARLDGDTILQDNIDGIIDREGDRAVAHFANTSFDTSDGWTVGSGWSITGGQAVHVAGSAGILQQPLLPPASAGETVTAVVDVTVNAGFLSVRLVGDSNSNTVNIRESGRYLVDLTSPSGYTVGQLVANDIFDGAVDQFIVFTPSPIERSLVDKSIGAKASKLFDADFASSNWTLGAGWTLSPTGLKKTPGVASAVVQALENFEVDQPLNFLIKLADVKSGAVVVRVAGSSVTNGGTYFESGYHFGTITPRSGTISLSIFGTAQFEGRIESFDIFAPSEAQKTAAEDRGAFKPSPYSRVIQSVVEDGTFYAPSAIITGFGFGFLPEAVGRCTGLKVAVSSLTVAAGLGLTVHRRPVAFGDNGTDYTSLTPGGDGTYDELVYTEQKPLADWGHVAEAGGYDSIFMAVNFPIDPSFIYLVDVVTYDESNNQIFCVARLGSHPAEANFNWLRGWRLDNGGGTSLLQANERIAHEVHVEARQGPHASSHGAEPKVSISERYDTHQHNRLLGDAESVSVRLPAVQITLPSETITVPRQNLTVTAPTAEVFSRTGLILRANARTATGYRFVDRAGLTVTEGGITLVEGTDYTLNEKIGGIIGATGFADRTVDITGTGRPSRYALISVNLDTGALVFTDGTPRDTDPQAVKPPVPANHVAIWEVFIWSQGVELIPVYDFRDFVRRDLETEFTRLVDRNRRALPNLFKKLRNGDPVKVAGYGDSITAISAGLDPAYHLVPNGPRDLIDYVILPADTLANVETFDFGDGLGQVHIKIGWNWGLVEAIEKGWNSVVTYENWGIGATSSSTGSNFAGAPNARHPDRLNAIIASAPDLVTIAFGTNAAPGLYDDLVALVQAFDAAGIESLIVPPPVPSLYGGAINKARWLRAHDTCVRAALDTGAAYLPSVWAGSDGFEGANGLSQATASAQNYFNHPQGEEFAPMRAFLGRLVD